MRKYVQKCLKCGSQNTIHKGKSETKKFGTRYRWRCKSCGKCFTTSKAELFVPKPKPKIKHETRLNYPNVGNLFRCVDNRILGERRFNIDSILGIPCFTCYHVDKNCEVSNCEKLDKWLENET